MHLEDIHSLVDQPRQSNLPNEPMYEADTAERRRTDASAHRELLVSTGKHWTALVWPRAPSETFVQPVLSMPDLFAMILLHLDRPPGCWLRLVTFPRLTAQNRTFQVITPYRVTRTTLDLGLDCPLTIGYV
jgi:hypothetical protein